MKSHTCNSTRKQALQMLRRWARQTWPVQYQTLNDERTSSQMQILRHSNQMSSDSTLECMQRQNKHRLGKHKLTCFSFLGFDFRFHIHQQSIQRQTVRQNEVSDVIPSNTQCLQLYRFSVLQCHFHCFEMRIHTDIHS